MGQRRRPSQTLRYWRAQAKPRPSVPIGGRTPESEAPCQPPIAKYEQLCYSTPMKWVLSPLLFLGACRIHEYCANHRESPCDRGAEGTSPRRIAFRGTMRLERMPFRDRLFGAIPLHYGSVTDPIQIPFRSFTTPLQLHYGSLRPITPLYWLRAYTHQNPAD